MIWVLRELLNFIPSVPQLLVLSSVIALGTCFSRGGYGEGVLGGEGIFSGIKSLCIRVIRECSQYRGSRVLLVHVSSRL